jgi:hypothetical protein
MFLAAIGNSKPGSSKPPWAYWMANEIEPVTDMNIPISPFKHPPNRFDYEKLPQRRQQEQQKKKKDDHKTTDSGDEFHIDDYA